MVSCSGAWYGFVDVTFIMYRCVREQSCHGYKRICTALANVASMKTNGGNFPQEMSNPYQPPLEATGVEPTAGKVSPSDPNDLPEQPGFMFYVAASLVVWPIILSVGLALVLIIRWLVTL